MCLNWAKTFRLQSDSNLRPLCAKKLLIFQDFCIFQNFLKIKKFKSKGVDPGWRENVFIQSMTDQNKQYLLSNFRRLIRGDDIVDLSDFLDDIVRRLK